MYTLVSASVLALDLVRHPSGGAVADVLDTALALSPWTSPPDGRRTVDLERAAARRRLLALAERAPRLDQALQAVTVSLGTGEEGRDVRVLQAALVGRLDDLVALLETELGERRRLSADVVGVVVDRAVAAWTSTTAPPDDLALLVAPWRSLVGELPPQPPHEGAATELLDLLEALAGTRRSGWPALDAAHEVEHRGLRWSELMHQGSRAAVDADRTLAVARWQLSGVRALSRSGAAPWPGAVMSVVGAVQALALRDVLPAAVVDGLLGPCRAVGLAPRP